MTQDPASLKSMPLYRDVERIYNELKAAGLQSGSRLSVTDLAAFDQYHYHGTDAVDLAITSLDINASDRVLEIGSGIGGPARYIAEKTGATVVALELQPDLDATARDLTRRCGMSDRVEHVCADAPDYSPGAERFDAIVSWLALFHIAQRGRLLANCMQWLAPTGGLYVEDLYARGELTKAEQEVLATILYSRYLPDLETYEADFRAAGFNSIQVDDMSEPWRHFTRERYDDFCRDRERHEKVHGTAIVAGLDNFYGAVAGLFAGGNLGGVRLTGKHTR